ncbi:hypothetical protein LX32DRAFT_636000 [Colletotrichum zoysiae]|uniref:Uncharacterized protein n=1 Tax=Colletotrichum zoysiae TaxID=1216348 RepID=A0AAD9HP31_9PEZI|nr:hypothetical protein LX32DRAFT_636000 [Colletotrichum zoysiae]
MFLVDENTHANDNHRSGIPQPRFIALTIYFVVDILLTPIAKPKSNPSLHPSFPTSPLPIS